MTDTPIYRNWTGLKARLRHNPNYASVRLDPRWATFEGFLANQPNGRSFEPGLCLARFGDQGDYTPENTRWATKSENRRDQHPLADSQCVHGHLYTPENTIHTKVGTKICRTCHKGHVKAYRARKKAAQ